MAEPADVTVCNVAARPTVVVKATTTWRDFPARWRPMLDEVYACVLDGPVVRSALPAGDVAMTVHRGPYQDLGAAHDRVKRWCTDNSRALAGPRWEIYGDWRDNPADLETEVYYLLS